MAIDTLQKIVDSEAGTSATDRAQLQRLQRLMLQQVFAAENLLDLLERLLQQLDIFASPALIAYLRREADGSLGQEFLLRTTGDPTVSNRALQRARGLVRQAVRGGDLVSDTLQDTGWQIIACPVVLRGSDPEVLVVAIQGDCPRTDATMLAQMMSLSTVLWHVISDSRVDDQRLSESAALLDLIDRVHQGQDLRQACYSLVAELAAHLDCETVAVGVRTTSATRVIAISGLASFDRRSSAAYAFQSAMDEAILRNELSRWPDGSDGRHALLSHKAICSIENVKSAVTSPLTTSDGTVVGGLTVLCNDELSLDRAERFLRLASCSIAAVLDFCQRQQGGTAVQFARAATTAWCGRRKWVATAIALLVAGMMLLPFPYRVPCDCRIEPVTRRYVAAPFKGSLEKSLVEPGDIVTQGQLLARMDGRELRWKRAGTVADKSQEMKRRDSAQASHSYGEQQIAQLEVDRLNLELQLLDHRMDHLEIRSPVSGIVVTGDLERAEGAPLTIGQTLFEIAPLEQMIVEVAIPDNEVAHVSVGDVVQIRLDAYAGDSWQATIENIQPRSEIIDQQNVFIAEANLDNHEGRLRPGMKGRAKVDVGSHPLGWILFHKPWEFVTKKLSW